MHWFDELGIILALSVPVMLLLCAWIALIVRGLDWLDTTVEVTE